MAGTLAGGALTSGGPAALPRALAEEENIFLEERESFEVATPPLTLARPDKGWVFIDPAVQRRLAAKERPSAQVEEEYRNLVARVFHYGTKALVSVHARKLDAGTPPDAARLETDLRADVASRKGAELAECGVAKVAGASAAALCAYVQPVDGKKTAELSGVYVYARLDLVHAKAGMLVTLFYEVPKERHAKAKAGWEKLVKRLQLK